MILLGGPAHGQEREIENGQSELIIMAPSPDNPLPTPFKYYVREIAAEIESGKSYRRKVLVEQTLTIDYAVAALSSVLLQRFTEELVRNYMKGGELIDGGQAEDLRTTSSRIETDSLST